MRLYLGTAIRTLLALLVLAGGVNFVVDPGEVLLRADVDADWFERYAAALETAPDGLPYVGASRERALKRVLARRDADCHVLGSSRASQLSSLRGGAIAALCPTLVNLWVPGGSLEDVIVLADAFLASATPRLVLAVDPWMLAFDATPGWRSHGEHYARALEAFGLEVPALPRTPARDRVLAAFSLPSFLASLSLVARNGADLGALYAPEVPAALPHFDWRVGQRGDVTLPDGSRVYERQVLADARAGRMERLRRSHVPREVDFDARAAAHLDAVVGAIRAAGREVVLLRVPFHPDVFARFPDRVAAYLAPAEVVLDELAARHGLDVYGDFDARALGCGHGEFKDLRHPLPECLGRIDWRRPRRPAAALAAARPAS